MKNKITFAQGNLLDSTAEALVNPVNCVGVMGKGLALEFKLKFPDNFIEYQRVCQQRALSPGSLFFTRPVHPTTRLIVNFPTKRHWREPSRLEDIQSGLQALRVEIIEQDIRSIAIPMLGCGLGGLKWDTVRPMIVDTMKDLNEVKVILFGLEN